MFSLDSGSSSLCSALNTQHATHTDSTQHTEEELIVSGATNLQISDHWTSLQWHHGSIQWKCSWTNQSQEGREETRNYVIRSTVQWINAVQLQLFHPQLNSGPGVSGSDHRVLWPVRPVCVDTSQTVTAVFRPNHQIRLLLFSKEPQRLMEKPRAAFSCCCRLLP